MNVLHLDAHGHDRIQTLLPGYAASRLSAAEQAEVDAHLAGCARCRAELAFDHALRALPAEPPVTDVDAGWAALRRQIDARRPLPPRRRTTRWPWWFGAQFALVAGLAAWLLWRPAAPDSDYRALGAGAPASANALVMFRPDATDAQIRAALQSGGAHLVGGPTETQAYLLRLPQADAPTLAALRRQPGVAMAESLEARRP